MSTDLDSKQMLDQNGYALVADAIDSGFLNRLRQRIKERFELEGESAGSEFKLEKGARRLGNLVNKGVAFREIIQQPMALRLVKHVLGVNFKLSSLNARMALPHQTKIQPLHCDMSAIPDRKGFWVCNCIWMLDDFTERNGALRVVPGSHRKGELPQDSMPDPTQAHPNEVILTGQAGSVIVMNAHLWHGGMANDADQPRTALHAFYCRRDKPQQQNQKALLDEPLQKQLSPDLRNMLALDDLDDEGPDPPVRSGFLE